MAVVAHVGVLISGLHGMAISQWGEAAMGNGMAYFFRGFSFFVRHPRLWRYAIVPWLINLSMMLIFAVLVVRHFGAVVDLAAQVIPDIEVSHWYQQILVAMLSGVKAAIVLAIGLTFVLVGYVVFLIIGFAVAGPFNDALSRRVEELQRGTRGSDSTHVGVLAELRYSLVDQFRRLGLYVVCQAILFPINLIPIVGSLLYATLSFVISSLFIGFEFVDHSMSRRRFTFSQKQAILRQHWLLIATFGVSLFVVFLIPLMNLVLLPLGVTGGTLLYADLEASRSSSGVTPIL